MPQNQHTAWFEKEADRAVCYFDNQNGNFDKEGRFFPSKMIQYQR